MTKRNRRTRGLTLVEMLVVTGIVAALGGVLLPVVGRARESAKTVECLSNLRQMFLGATSYAVRHNGAYPIAYYAGSDAQNLYAFNWDFTLVRERATGMRSVRPGLLWYGAADGKVQQCPSFDGRSNTLMDPYTGYNYNTSFIGRGETELIKAPAHTSDVRSPAGTVLFGDGEWGGGANKYMRSPLPSASDSNLSARHAGTQGYRHRGQTNVVFADGHAESRGARFTAGRPVAEGTGFLSEDNSLYDLE